jgi:hypothetical protein
MVCQSKILTNLQIMRIISISDISDITDIMYIMCIIGITISAWVSVLNPIFQKMSSIKCTIFLFNMKVFFATRPLADFLKKDKAVSQAGTNGKRKLYYLHIDVGIKQFVKGLFAGGVPYWHLKVLDQERTNHLVQDQEQEIPATERNVR